MTEKQAMSEKAVYEAFFEHGEVRSDFKKEYISLWSGWLGEERLYLLDEVSEPEWLRFNGLLLAAFEAFRLGAVNHSAETIELPACLELLPNDYNEAMRKDASQLFQFFIPVLDCVMTEEWDYIYIFWYLYIGSLERIKPLLYGVKLEHFSDYRLYQMQARSAFSNFRDWRGVAALPCRRGDPKSAAQVH